MLYLEREVRILGMFRKLLLTLAILLALVSVLPAKLAVSNYSDTGKPYISQEWLQNGVFTNGRTKGSDMKWYTVITNTDVSLIIYYHGTTRLERAVNTELPVFQIKAVDDQGEAHSFTGRLFSDRIMVDEDWAFRFLIGTSRYVDLTLKLVGGDLTFTLDRFYTEDFAPLFFLTYSTWEEPEPEPVIEPEPEPVIEEELVIEEEEPVIEEEPAAEPVKEALPAKLNPQYSVGVNAGYLFPVTEDDVIDESNLRVGATFIGYPLQIKNILNLGFRVDVSAFTYGEDKAYQEFDASLSFYLSHFFPIGRSFSIGVEGGIGAGYLHSTVFDDDDTDNFLMRVPVGVDFAFSNGIQLAVECFVDLFTDSFSDFSDSLVFSLTPALSFRYAF